MYKLSNYTTISLEIKLNEVQNACKYVIADISVDGILGLPFFTDTECKLYLDFSKKHLEVNDSTIDGVDREDRIISQTIRSTKTVTNPARYHYIIWGKMKHPTKHSEMIVDSSSQFVSEKSVQSEWSQYSGKGVQPNERTSYSV